MILPPSAATGIRLNIEPPAFSDSLLDRTPEPCIGALKIPVVSDQRSLQPKAVSGLIQFGGETKLILLPVFVKSVKVIDDPNSSPPGLYTKSIVIGTGNRDIQFTASSKDRHELWMSVGFFPFVKQGWTLTCLSLPGARIPAATAHIRPFKRSTAHYRQLPCINFSFPSCTDSRRTRSLEKSAVLPLSDIGANKRPRHYSPSVAHLQYP